MARVYSLSTVMQGSSIPRGKADTVGGLIGKLVAAESLYGEAGVAHRLGVKVRMWRYAKAGEFGLSTRVLRAVLRNFPALRDEVVDYLTADEGLGKEVAA